MEPWKILHGGMFKHQLLSTEGVSLKYVSCCGRYYSEDINVGSKTLVVNNERFNPQLQTTEEVILETLVGCFKRCDEKELMVKEREEGDRLVAILTVITTFYEMKFNWEVILHDCSNLFQNSVMDPFLNTIHLLLKQQKLLVQTLKKKDAEISEFRSLGVKLSKKSILSPVFNSEVLKSIKLDSIHDSFKDSIENVELKEVFTRAGERAEKSAKFQSKKKVLRMGVRFDESDDDSGEENLSGDIKDEETPFVKEEAKNSLKKVKKRKKTL